MRHNKKFNHLGRQRGHRKAMLANMATSLIIHKRISTTIAKAKALRIYVEPVISKSKEDSTHSRRMVFSALRDKHAVTELFRTIAPEIMDRPGGYTRILKTGFRLGDAADMCIIELVDFNDAYGSEAVAAKPRTRRGRGGAKKEDGATDAEVINEVAGEATEAKAKAKVAPKKAAKKPAAKGAKTTVSAAKMKTSGGKKAASRSVGVKKG